MLPLLADATAQAQALAPHDAATEIPAPVRAMLDAATASGNEADIAAITRYAHATLPQSAAVIDRYVADRKAQSKLARKNFFQQLKGRIEIGGYTNAGGTHNSGYTGSATLAATDGAWTYKLRLLANYQHSLGVTTRDNYLALYETNYRLSPRAWFYGAAKYESDRFLGYDDRYTLSAGLGYSPIKRPDMTLDFEAGPAWRYTSFADGTTGSQLSGRGVTSFRAKLFRSLTFLENASVYLEGGDSTLNSKTALQARVIGPLSTQLSYTVQYESKSLPELHLEQVNTTSRASLVLDF